MFDWEGGAACPRCNEPGRRTVREHTPGVRSTQPSGTYLRDVWVCRQCGHEWLDPKLELLDAWAQDTATPAHTPAARRGRAG